EFLVQRELQIRRTGTTAGTHPSANHPLDKLNMPQPPAHNQLIEFGEALANVDPVTMLVLLLVQREHGTSPRVELFTVGRFRIQMQCPHPRQRLEEYVVQRWLAQTPCQLRISFRRRAVIPQHLLILQAAQEFQFAKLFRLKSTRRFELSAKREEVR